VSDQTQRRRTKIAGIETARIGLLHGFLAVLLATRRTLLLMDGEEVYAEAAAWVQTNQRARKGVGPAVPDEGCSVCAEEGGREPVRAEGTE